MQQELKGKVSTAIEGAQNVQMKEIRGLGDRLSGLEQLLLEAKRLVQEQQKLAAAFVQNQQRASGLRDVSILPDLCASHRQQLLVMQKNHQQIISICNRSGWLLFIGTIHLRRQHVLGWEGCPHVPMVKRSQYIKIKNPLHKHFSGMPMIGIKNLPTS